tara:strand:- start:279 stop:902 length:624 start_codon:yes stop_codon:yes gene_type:complete
MTVFGQSNQRINVVISYYLIMKIGYCRVSTTDQSLDTQVQKLKDEGCERIYKEKISGKSSKNRPQLQKMLEDVRSGDLVMVTKLDRLGRSILDLHQIVNQLQDKKVDFKILSNPDMDTTSPFGKLIFSILGTISEFERSMILERTKDGRENYVRNGGKLGRKKKFSQEEIDQIQFLHKEKGMSFNQLKERFNCSRITIYRTIHTKKQ